jgi:choline dehydrogenase
MNQRAGRRWSATRAFLRPALDRPNLTLITKAHVRKVLLEGRRATGIDMVVDGKGEGMAKAVKAVILAAGSIGSPQLLQLSGIGPAALLQQSGIPVELDSPGVGSNLHDHLQIRMMWKVDGPTLNERANRWTGKAAMALEYFLFHTGPLTMPPSQLGAFAKSDAMQASPNIEWHVQPLSLEKFGDPLHPFPAITPSVCNLRPTSRGHVRIKSADPMAAPEIRRITSRLTTSAWPRNHALHAPNHTRRRSRNIHPGMASGPQWATTRRSEGGGRPGNDDLPPGGNVPHGPGRRRRRR